MQTAQESCETPSEIYTKGPADAGKVNDGFEVELPNNNNLVKHDEMALKTTVVSILGNEAGEKMKSRHSRSAWITTIILLALAALALIVALVVVLTLYVQETDDSEVPVNKICFKDNCIVQSAEILGYMNRSANPCEDFYSFACGGWQAKTFIPTTETQVSILSSLNEANKDFMRNYLADPATKTKYSSNRAVTKAIDYYRTCMSKEAINKQGINYLKEVIETLGGSNLTSSNWNSSEYDVEKAMIATFTQFGVQPFFSVNVFPDFTDSTKRRFGISDGGIVLASTFYVENNSTQEFYDKTRDSYRQYMVDVMVLFGADRERAEAQMEQVYLLEAKIAQVFRENTGMPHPSTIDQLSAFTKFDWYSFLTGLTANQNYNLSRNEVILVRNKHVMKGVVALLNNTDKAILSNYIAWIVIEDVIQYLPDDYLAARFAYKKRIHGDSYEDTERWSFCYDAAKTAFPMPIGLMFVEEKLDANAKERAKEIFEEIRREFVLELPEQTWMDDATREKAREKAEASAILVGYPEFIKDEEKLNAEYEAISVNRNEFLKTVFSIKSLEFLKQVSDYKKPVDRNRFSYSPADVNGYHYRQENKNVFLAGILRAPFYDDRRLRASNYGGIGMVAGHELTHGFDINGRIYDKNGNQLDWWSRNSSLEYQRKSLCFLNQYKEFEMYGKKVNGHLTLGENTADNGGLKFAYEAYKRWVAKNGEEEKLPGLDFTPYQLFFISYAQCWCSRYTLQGALNQLDNRPWPPMNIRVDGALMNSEGFSKAFQCKRGARMNPEKKCSVW